MSHKSSGTGTSFAGESRWFLWFFLALVVTEISLRRPARSARGVKEEFAGGVLRSLSEVWDERRCLTMSVLEVLLVY